jgi:hypothetical protein
VRRFHSLRKWRSVDHRLLKKWQEAHIFRRTGANMSIIDGAVVSLQGLDLKEVVLQGIEIDCLPLARAAWLPPGVKSSPSKVLWVRHTQGLEMRTAPPSAIGP